MSRAAAGIAAVLLATIAGADRSAQAGNDPPRRAAKQQQLPRGPYGRVAVRVAPAGGVRRAAKLRVGIGSIAAPGAPTLWSDRLRLTESSIDVAASADTDRAAMPGRLAAGFRLGYVTDLHKIASPAALADVSLRLPYGAEQVEIGAEVGTWSRRLRENDDGAMVTRSLKAVPLRARVIYQVPVARFSLFGGVGGGVVLTRTEVLSPTMAVASTARGRAPAAGALLGARLRAGRGRLELEGGWWRAAPGRAELQSSIAGLELSAGYALSF